MTTKALSDKFRLTFMERDERGVLAIADGQMQYLGGQAGFAALEEHLGDGNFQKLDCDDGRECYLREGAEPPAYLIPHLKHGL